MDNKYICIINKEQFSNISEINIRKLLKTEYQISDTMFSFVSEYLKTASIRQQLHIRTAPYHHEIDLYIQKTA